MQEYDASDDRHAQEKVNLYERCLLAIDSVSCLDQTLFLLSLMSAPWVIVRNWDSRPPLQSCVFQSAAYSRQESAAEDLMG